MKIVLVEWSDAAHGNLWTDRDTPMHPDPVVSIGILASEDDKAIELIPSLTKDYKLQQIAIPKGTIKRIRRLKL